MAHFTSADTIIPQPGNSGDWNRYAYVLYNPANFNDPKGHSYSGHEEDNPVDIDLVSKEGKEYAIQVAESTGNVVEAWAATSDFVAMSVFGDVDSYMIVMNNIFGHSGDALEISLNDDDLYIGPTAVVEQYSIVNHPAFQSSEGFALEYQDPDENNNQVHHTHYWIQMGFFHGYFTSGFGNFYHEYLQNEGGQSQQDYLAGSVGIYLGNQLWNGNISPYSMGYVIMETFGEQTKPKMNINLHRSRDGYRDIVNMR